MSRKYTQNGLEDLFNCQTNFQNAFKSNYALTCQINPTHCNNLLAWVQMYFPIYFLHLTLCNLKLPRNDIVLIT